MPGVKLTFQLTKPSHPNIANYFVATNDCFWPKAATRIPGCSEWRLGVGKYVFETTTLGIKAAILDSNAGRDGSVVAVAMTHLGDFGGSWQYAVDLGYSHTDFDFNLILDTWAAHFSLYPTRDFEIGIAIEDVSEKGNSRGLFETTGVEGFASWYVTPKFSLSARYRKDDVEYSGLVLLSPPSQSDADQETYGVAATIRF